MTSQSSGKKCSKSAETFWSIWPISLKLTIKIFEHIQQINLLFLELNYFFVAALFYFHHLGFFVAALFCCHRLILLSPLYFVFATSVFLSPRFFVVAAIVLVPLKQQIKYKAGKKKRGEKIIKRRPKKYAVARYGPSGRP